MYKAFIDSIEKLLKDSNLWDDNYKIIANPKRSGQSFCFFIYENGKKRMVAKFFDYLKGLNAITEFVNTDAFSTVDEYINSLDDSPIPYELNKINEIVYYLKRSFDRYIDVTSNTEGLFPKVYAYSSNIKLINSFFGLLIEEAIDGETLESKHKKIKLDKVENVNLSKSLLHSIGKTIKKYYEYGLVHRDLSPDNIMVTPNEKFVVIDPGTIKIINRDSTNYGYIMGKQMYASPEQYYGNACKADFSSELYSLGIICYEMITGINLIDKYLTQGSNRPHDNILDKLDREVEDIFYEFCDENNEKNILLFSVLKKMLQPENLYRFENVDSFLEALSTLGGE